MNFIFHTPTPSSTYRNRFFEGIWQNRINHSRSAGKICQRNFLSSEPTGPDQKMSSHTYHRQSVNRVYIKFNHVILENNFPFHYRVMFNFHGSFEDVFRGQLYKNCWLGHDIFRRLKWQPVELQDYTHNDANISDNSSETYHKTNVSCSPLVGNRAIVGSQTNKYQIISTITLWFAPYKIY